LSDSALYPAPSGSKGVSIASGAHVPRIDLEALFQRDDEPEAASLSRTVVTGGSAQAPAVAPSRTQGVATDPPKSRTVALTDGTRITFAAEDWVNTLESA
jgi:hypothetical protein